MRQNMTSSFQVSLVKSTNQIPIRSSMHMELAYSRGSPVLSLYPSLFRRAQVVFQELFDTPNRRIAGGTINSPGTEKRWLAWLRKIKGPRSSDP